MRLRLIIASIFVTLIFATAVIASGQAYTLSKGEKNVETDVGLVTLYEGTNVGGDPYNYISLTEGIFLQTTDGEIFFEAGTKVDCDVPPGHPDPCDPY